MTDDDRGAGVAADDSIEERVWRSVTTLKRPGRDARPVTFGDLAPIFAELRRLAFVIEGSRGMPEPIVETDPNALHVALRTLLGAEVE